MSKTTDSFESRLTAFVATLSFGEPLHVIENGVFRTDDFDLAIKVTRNLGGHMTDSSSKIWKYQVSEGTAETNFL